MNHVIFVLICVSAIYGITAHRSGRVKREIHSLHGDMFTLNTESMTWHQAKEWCESRRSELLKLPTDTILDLFNSQLAASTFVDDNGVPITQVFIGLSDLGEEGNFRYTDNGYASVEYWAPNQPDNYGGNEHCVAINALDPELRWEDVSCDETHAFACLNSLISLLWFPYDGKIYKYRQAFSTWHGAVEECREDAGHLIQISSQVMVDLSNQLALHDNVDANRAIWIDANDIDSEGNWQYADGTPLTYTNWNTGEPNNGLANVIEEDCAVMLPDYQSLWNDVDCDLLGTLLCQFEYPDVNWEIVTDQLSWEDAQAYCVQRGSHLARFRTCTEHMYLTMLLGSLGMPGAFWLDGRDLGHDGEYTYSNGWPPHFGIFSTEIQSNGIEDCMLIDYGVTDRVIAADCNIPLKFVCQSGDEASYTTLEPPLPTTARISITTHGIQNKTTAMFTQPETKVSTYQGTTPIQIITSQQSTWKPVSTVSSQINNASGTDIIPVVAGVLGGLLALAATGILLFLIKRKKKNNEGKTKVSPKETKDDTPDDTV